MEPITKRSSQSRLTPPASPWTLLPPDLVREISGRLSDAPGFVRLHAVCRPWWEAAPSLLSPAATRPRFRPWLLTLCNNLFLHLPINYGCISSEKPSSYDRHGYDGVALPSALSSGNRNLVASTVGTSVGLFTLHPEPTLVDLLTGVSTPLPRFPVGGKKNKWMKKSRGLVYGDGTVFMYSIVSDRRYNINDNDRSTTFTAAILRAGDVAWKLVKKTLPWTTASPRLSVAYHDKKILACKDLQFGLLLNLDFEGNGDMGGEWKNWTSDIDPRVDTEYDQDCYVFESQGEFMRASVLVGKEYWCRGCSGDDPTCALSVVVHAIEGVDGDGTMRWVERDGQSLIDHVLFLGSPASFTVNAAQLGLGGGCAYFVFRKRVFKYSLIDHEAKLMERVRPWWGSDMMHVWVQPHAAFPSVHDHEEHETLVETN